MQRVIENWMASWASRALRNFQWTSVRRWTIAHGGYEARRDAGSPRWNWMTAAVSRNIRLRSRSETQPPTRRRHRGSFCSLIKSKVMLNRPNIDRDDARSARVVSIPLQISAFQRDLRRISRFCFLLFSSFARVCVFARCRYWLKEKLSCGIFPTGNCEWAGIFCSTAGHVEFEIKREISSFPFHRFLPCRYAF